MNRLCVLIVLVTAMVGFDSVHGDCDQTFNATEGTIPVPANVVAGDICHLTITRSTAKEVQKFTQLLLSNFDLQGSSFLEIYDGVSKQSADLLLNISGNSDAPGLAVTFDVTTTIVFYVKSNASSAWSLEYDTKGCKQQLENTWTVRALSPKYLPSRGDFTCTFNVTSSLPNNRIAFATFLDVSLGKSSVVVESGKINVTVTGVDSVPDFFADGSAPIVITLNATNSTVVQRFVAVFTPVITDCSGAKDIGDNYVWHMKVPTNQPADYICRKVLTVQKGTILAKITGMVLLPGLDTLTFVDGDSSKDQIVASLSDKSVGYLVTSSAKALLLVLKLSDGFGERSLDISFVRQASGGRFSGGATLHAGSSAEDDTAAITTSAYFQLAASAEQLVNVQVLTKLTANATLTFYNGPQASDQMIIKSTATSQTLTEVIGGGQMLLALENFATTDNFTAVFNSINPGCDTLLTTKTGKFSFMGSTRKVNKTETCTWTVAAMDNTGTIVLSFDGLNLGTGESVSVYSGPVTAAPVATYAGVFVASPLPQIYLPAGNIARIVLKLGATLRSATNVVARYNTVPNACGGSLSQSEGLISTPNFPNQYPLNAQCVWTFNVPKELDITEEKAASKNFLFVDFATISLAQKHSISVVDAKNASHQTVLATYGGSKLPNSLLVPANAKTNVQFQSLVKTSNASSTATGASYKVASGASLNYWILGCGGNVTASNGTIQSPGFPKPPSASVLCVWIVQVPAATKPNSTNIIQFNITAKGSSAKSVDKYLKIFNGPSLRDPVLTAQEMIPPAKAKPALSNYTSMILVLNITQEVKKKVDLTLSIAFASYNCNATFMCNNGMCMHPDWRCNGVNDCGDFTDEKDCGFKPPAPSSQSGMVKSVWVVVTLFIGLLVGGLVVIFLPKIVRRFRRSGGSYDRMHDPSPIVT